MTAAEIKKFQDFLQNEYPTFKESSKRFLVDLGIDVRPYSYITSFSISNLTNSKIEETAEPQIIYNIGVSQIKYFFATNTMQEKNMSSIFMDYDTLLINATAYGKDVKTEGFVYNISSVTKNSRIFRSLNNHYGKYGIDEEGILGFLKIPIQKLGGTIPPEISKYYEEEIKLMGTYPLRVKTSVNDIVPIH